MLCISHIWFNFFVSGLKVYDTGLHNTSTLDFINVVKE
jgi:hypothetical protein